MFPVPLTAPPHSFEHTSTHSFQPTTLEPLEAPASLSMPGRRVNSAYWDDGYANPVYDYSSDSTSGSTPKIRRTRQFRSSGNKFRPRSLSTSSDMEEIQTALSRLSVPVSDVAAQEDSTQQGFQRKQRRPVKKPLKSTYLRIPPPQSPCNESFERESGDKIFPGSLFPHNDQPVPPALLPILALSNENLNPQQQVPSPYSYPVLQPNVQRSSRPVVVIELSSDSGSDSETDNEDIGIADQSLSYLTANAVTRLRKLHLTRRTLALILRRSSQTTDSRTLTDILSTMKSWGWA